MVQPQGGVLSLPGHELNQCSIIRHQDGQSKKCWRKRISAGIVLPLLNWKKAGMSYIIGPQPEDRYGRTTTTTTFLQPGQG
jgi:hypothetical protein